MANPIASDQNLLRSSLLPGIWKNIKDNAVTSNRSVCSRSATKIHPTGEVPHFAAALYAKDDGVAGLLELKRLAECSAAGNPCPACRPTLL